MKILYVCHRFPYPPKRGGTIRPFNMIKHLHAAGHEVVVCSLTRSDDMTKEAQGIAPYCSEFHIGQVDDRVQTLRMLATVPTPWTASEAFFHSSKLDRTIRRLLAERKFDLIFVHCSSVAHYVERVQGIPKILDFGDMDSAKWLEYAQHKAFPRSLGYWWEGVRLRAEEKRLARLFDLCTTITRAECQTLIDYGTGAPTDWFPNGVDNMFFAPVTEDYDPDSIVFIGRMDYFPNQQGMLDFCRDTLPLLRARRPSVKLTIVGADPSAEIRALGEIPGVTVTGTVPDVRPYVTRAALTVAPLRIARGTQNKILEAMAMGIPVVCSQIAAGGVDAVPGEHLLAADAPAEQAEAILRVLEDPSLRERLAKAGRERVLTNHAWPSSMRRLDAIIERCLAAYPSSSQLQAQSS
ncbi:MAG: TIGR03087 family PEP-CTERM/XrtA system glycosyltransferase [Piscinibacter sp.]|uniref:TIGR03087 family PEP-CTERM/XrtA system glycosyltransferase n=1 Tax=Piscinibacter sp. TaxID=1903157 RepID=UPI002583962C|nr:TIGR03087 family PEP-CTERM/XrtA system glycosyltransferase [Piscinibacter sp.]MCW5662453.1 TIGR03087 family PEP-CTERM/XrtA system glycosyltransferase [Piscinibacter sp.]